MGITVVICVVSLVFLGWNFKQAFGDQSQPKITAKQVIKPTPEAMDLDDVIEMGGWAQILNQDYQVVYRRGIPKF